MTAVWAWLLSTRVGRWLAVTGAVLAAIVTAWIGGMLKGRRSQSEADKAKDAKAQADADQQVIKAANLREDVENEVETLPTAPSQSVATGAPATAVGELRDDGWVRPASPDGN